MEIKWDRDTARCGVVVGRPHRKERWIIGYLASHELNKPYLTLNSLVDGMVQGPYTQEELVQKLNKSQELPAEILDNPRYTF